MCFSSPANDSVHVKIRNSNFIGLGVCSFIKGKLLSTCIPLATRTGTMTMYDNKDDDS